MLNQETLKTFYAQNNHGGMPRIGEQTMAKAKDPDKRQKGLKDALKVFTEAWTVAGLKPDEITELQEKFWTNNRTNRTQLKSALAVECAENLKRSLLSEVKK